MTGIKIIKIFLASSSELKDDREQFEIFINRKNKEYIKQSVFLELVIWEDFLDAMSATRLQDEYNKAITDCNVFVSLFKTKVGRYTEEEFLKALETFKSNQKPLIYTYFKDSQISISQITIEISSLLNFKKKLRELEHFYKSYRDINELKFLFDQQLNKFLPEVIDTIKTASQPEKQELEQSLKSQIKQLEELEEERSHNQKLAESQQFQAGDKQSEITDLQETIRSQQKQIGDLTKKLDESRLLYDSFQSRIKQLKQQLAQERSRFTKQQTNLQAAQEKIAEKESIIAQLQKHIEQLKSDPKTTAKDEVELKSEKGVDYTKLVDLLAAGEWKLADEETAKVMLEAASRESEGWLREEDIYNFPCEDLRTINKLWLHYSNEKFGFSVQKEIYKELGGKRKYDKEVWNNFVDRIGWRKKGGNMLSYDDLIFNLDEAPAGHLPARIEPVFVADWLSEEFLFGFEISSLVQRLVKCIL